jgi:hypothetical protein
MIIERTNAELILRLPIEIGTLSLDKITKYVKYVESNSGSNFDEAQINEIAAESKKRWWEENKHKFIK